MAVEIDITYQGDLRCVATHGPSQQILNTEAPVDNGGRGEDFSPTDLVATALGTCVSTIMGLVARQNGLDISGCQVQVIKEMMALPVRRIGQLSVRITLPAGKPLSAEDRLKLEQAAEICPVKKSLHPEVAVRFEFVYPS